MSRARSNIRVIPFDDAPPARPEEMVCNPDRDARGAPQPPDALAAFAAQELLPAMRKVAPETAIETESQTSVPAFAAAPQSEAVALAMTLTGANRTSGVSYATEAGLFERAGCPAVVCGPGDIAQAHAADEFVSVAQLEACLTFLADLTARLRA
jgi:acetylornithine deacetylase